MWTQFHVCMEQRPVWVSSAGLDCLMRAQEDREGGHQQQSQVLRTCALVRIRFVQPLLLTTHWTEVHFWFFWGVPSQTKLPVDWHNEENKSWGKIQHVISFQWHSQAIKETNAQCEIQLAPALLLDPSHSQHHQSWERGWVPKHWRKTLWQNLPT